MVAYIRKMGRNKNGNPKPSFAPDSADSINRTDKFTLFSAKRPLTIELHNTGSVGAMQAAQTKASIKGIPQIATIPAADINHITTMTGPNSHINGVASLQR